MTTTAPEVEAPVLTYTTLDDLAAKAAEVVVAYWGLRATMPEADWLDLIVGILTSILGQAEGIGRAYGAVAVAVDGHPIFPEVPTVKPYRPIPDDFEAKTTNIAPGPDDTITEDRIEEIREQVEKAVYTLAKDLDRPATEEEAQPNLERVERMAKDETIAQIQRGVQDGVRIRSEETGIVGYRRGINPDACELCFWLWKDGFVYPIDQPMHRHTGCRCVPVPTTDSIGRHKYTPEDQALSVTLYERYTSETLRETSFRRTEAQEAQ